jgi:hypothetical protein
MKGKGVAAPNKINDFLKELSPHKEIHLKV